LVLVLVEDLEQGVQLRLPAPVVVLGLLVRFCTK
jgi:hypothetical protein